MASIDQNMTEYFPRTPLSDDEIRQLHELLARYLYYHAAGIANKAIDLAIEAFNKKFGKVSAHEPAMIEYLRPAEPIIPQTPGNSTKRKRAR
jgi:N-acetyl-anhydromuramyl-L-alanine amidase AmpD